MIIIITIHMSIVTILIAHIYYTCLVCMISIIFLNIFYAIFAGDAAYIYRKIIIYVVYLVCIQQWSTNKCIYIIPYILVCHMPITYRLPYKASHLSTLLSNNQKHNIVSHFHAHTYGWQNKRRDISISKMIWKMVVCCALLWLLLWSNAKRRIEKEREKKGCEWRRCAEDIAWQIVMEWQFSYWHNNNNNNGTDRVGGSDAKTLHAQMFYSQPSLSFLLRRHSPADATNIYDYFIHGIYMTCAVRVMWV